VRVLSPRFKLRRTILFENLSEMRAIIRGGVWSAQPPRRRKSSAQMPVVSAAPNMAPYPASGAPPAGYKARPDEQGPRVSPLRADPDLPTPADYLPALPSWPDTLENVFCNWPPRRLLTTAMMATEDAGRDQAIFDRPSRRTYRVPKRSNNDFIPASCGTYRRAAG